MDFIILTSPAGLFFLFSLLFVCGARYLPKKSYLLLSAAALFTVVGVIYSLVLQASFAELLGVLALFTLCVILLSKGGRKV